MPFSEKNTASHFQDISQSGHHICIGSKHKGDYVAINTIIYLEAYGGYTWFHLSDDSKVLSVKSIGYYQEIFSSEGFIRIHRSYLVNPSQIKKYEPDYRLIHLKRTITLPVSVRRNRQLSKKKNMMSNTKSKKNQYTN